MADNGNDAKITAVKGKVRAAGVAYFITIAFLIVTILTSPKNNIGSLVILLNALDIALAACLFVLVSASPRRFGEQSNFSNSLRYLAAVCGVLDSVTLAINITRLVGSIGAVAGSQLRTFVVSDALESVGSLLLIIIDIAAFVFLGEFNHIAQSIDNTKKKE